MRKTPGLPLISKRQLFLSAMSIGIVFGTSTVSLAQQTLDFDTVMAKEGGYAGIVSKFLGTNDPKIISFLKREGDRYIASLPMDNQPKAIRTLRANLIGITGKAKDPTDKPTYNSAEFFRDNAPQVLIEFIPYEREYPNIAELGRWLKGKAEANEAQRRAAESEEALRRLRAINGKRP